MHLATIHKIKIIFAIFYIFYGVQDNYTEKMVVPNKLNNVVKKNIRQFFSYLGGILVVQLLPRLFILQLQAYSPVKLVVGGLLQTG